MGAGSCRKGSGRGAGRKRDTERFRAEHAPGTDRYRSPSHRRNLFAVRSRSIRLLACCALFLGAGCASSYRQLDGTLQLYRQGDLEGAADWIQSPEFDDEREGDRHGVLWLLETGKIMHDVGRFGESETAFEQADARIRTQEQGASMSLSEEVAGILTTQQSRTFRARHWQKILLESYRALNQLALGNLDEALVMARRSYARQADAIFDKGKEIEKREEGTEGKQVDEAELMSQDSVQELLAPVQSRITPAYADYANPFTSYLAALLQWADGDQTRAIVDMQKTQGMVPGNEFVAALVTELDGGHSLATPEGRVYVIFENGLAPERIETGIAIVTPNGYSSIRMPMLQYIDTPVVALELSDTAGALNLQTAPLADVDAMVSVDFADELPGIVVRTVLSVVTKEVTTKQMRDSNQDLGFLVGTFWKAMTEGADLRTWRTVGARFEVAHFDRPADGLVRLNLLDQNGGRHLTAELELPETTLCFLLCRSVNLASLRTHTIQAGDPLPSARDAAPPLEETPTETPAEAPPADPTDTPESSDEPAAEAATAEERDS
jgi:uncharacterized protein